MSKILGRLVLPTLVLCILMSFVVCTFVCAESFSIRSDVKFGDTTQSVKSKESLHLVYDEHNELRYKGKIAGFDDSFLIYYFDDNKELIDIVYRLADSSSIGDSETQRRWTSLYNSLLEKYGEPASIDSAVHNKVHGEMTKACMERVELSKTLKIKNKYYSGETEMEYVSWVVPSGSYNVKIELIAYYASSNFGDSKKIYIDYHSFTNQDLEETKEPMSISNDL